MTSESTGISGGKQFSFAAPRWVFFALFTLSGFTGLIYESIWSHYLKLFLGHAAYAQSLVLVIFMGGLAGGSWLSARFSGRISRPLLFYAIAEAIIGIFALVFHGVFQVMTDSFYFSILPELGSPALGSALKWSAAALLIIPQSVLLGMTFPLMSTGILRRFPGTQGGSLSMLYFTNSIGAAIGVLASGFWMIGKFGLPGTVFTAGLLNIALAMVVWMLVRLDPMGARPPLTTSATDNKQKTSSARIFLIAAGLTGAASFIYEIAWIRMLSLVLGAATHSFELMLSAFITGLAFGGLWIRKRIDGISNPIRFSGKVQILMGMAALATLPVYSASFGWMESLVTALSPNQAGFTAYQLGSHAIALAVMLPATFLAGMTLPLFTLVLLKEGEGESSIGRIYAANTLGAIIGVVFAVHIGLPYLGLRNLVVFGVLIDVVLGIYLLARAAQKSSIRPALVMAFVALGAISLVMFRFELDQGLLASGVYRTGDLDSTRHESVQFYADGKTSTVTLRQLGNEYLTLATNGKPEAGIFIGEGDEFTIDEVTMAMAGAIGLAYKTDARTAGIIGLGAGITTQTLLHDADMERVDTVEIEPEVIRGARGFGPHVDRVYNDPRSHLEVEDAKTFFSLHNRQYDLIITEPSNPWVSGVATLFSGEFYRMIKNYMSEDGVFIQWIHLYEFDDDLVFSILKAMAPHFRDFHVYNTTDLDMLVVASGDNSLGKPDFSRLFQGEMAQALEAIGIGSANDLLIRQTANRDILVPLFRTSNAPANSDFYPYLDLNAISARFQKSESKLVNELGLAPLPLLEMVARVQPDFDNLSGRDRFSRSQAASAANGIYQMLTGKIDDGPLPSLREDLYLSIQNLLLMDGECKGTNASQDWARGWFQVATVALPFLNQAEASELVAVANQPACWSSELELNQAWGALYTGIANRNAGEMVSGGSTILEHPAPLASIQQFDYVLGATVLGLVQQGRYLEAQQLFEQHSVAPESRGEPYPTYLLAIIHLAYSSQVTQG